MDPLDLQEAVRLVHQVNPQLNRKQRKSVVIMGKGNPEALVTLANLPKAQMREVEKAKAKRKTIEEDFASSSQFSSVSPSRGDRESEKGLDYNNEASRFSIDSNSNSVGDNTSASEEELNILTLLRGASGDSSGPSTPADQVAPASVTDFANVKIAAAKLGFAVDLPPTTLRRARTDPSGKKKKSIRSRPGSVKEAAAQSPKSISSEPDLHLN